MDDDRLKIGLHVSKVTIIGNVLLTIIKIAIGFFSCSSAMIADGVHSLSDVLSTIVVMLGLKLSSKPADKNHQYGHEKFESLSSIILAIMLFIVAICIGYSSLLDIINSTINTPGITAVFAAILSIISKEWMYRYTIKYSKLINSTSLKADAWHHRSDAFSSLGALIGIVGARMGIPILDPLAGIIISIIIIKVSYDILKPSIYQIIDHSVNDELTTLLREKVSSIDGVINIDSLKTRLHGNRIYIDLEISVDGSISVRAGHDIAEKVRKLIELDSRVKHCMVHVNPIK